MEGDKRFRELIDRSFVEEVSEGERRLMHDHIRDCDGCKRYVELTARTIRGLREFTFTSEADSSAQVLEILAHHTETMRQHNVQFKVWAAFAVALSMSIVGSALVYQVAKFLTAPMHFDNAQVQAGVLVFWLLPSFCAALYTARGAWSRIEVLHDTAIGGAFGSVLGRACSCGCLVGSRKTEYSTQVCNGHRSTGDPDLGSLFCFQPGPFPTCFQRISQYHAGRALVWLDVWRLHRSFFPCPRLCLRGCKKASNACVGLGDCRVPHTQFDWIHPLLCVPRISPRPLQFLWQAYSRGRSILLTLRMLAGFQYRTHHSWRSHKGL